MASSGGSKPETVASATAKGNAAAANGLMIEAKRWWRIADAIQKANLDYWHTLHG